MKIVACFLVVALCGCATKKPATPQQAIASTADLWGDGALRQPGGPSYEFFEKLIPPLRYVEADFGCYPIVLSAPGAIVKGRLVSDGSAINALAREPGWQNEQGIPVHVRIGNRRVPFGSNLAKLIGPHYLEGYPPIVRLQDGDYSEEVFAAVDDSLAAVGAVIVKFDLPESEDGRVELRIEGGPAVFKSRDGVVRDVSGKALAVFDDNWEFAAVRCALVTKVQHAKTAVAMIFTQPAEWSQPRIDAAFADRQRSACAAKWKAILDQGTQIEVPEPVVNNAARSLVIANDAIRAGDQLNYSASNQYARQYSNESGDTMRSMLLWGQTQIARNSIKPLFVYRRPGIELHDGAFKLELLADYYFVTRDAALIHELQPLWQREIDLILTSRDPSTGLLPKEAYCSDIRTPVRSLNTNANCWRGLRDMALVLDETGDHAQAAKLTAIATDYRKAILAAMDKAIVRTVDPNWVPVALDGEEPPAKPITATRMGSYWNLVVPCVLGSGIFPMDSPPADAIIHTIERNGGLCMGLTRVQSARAGGWNNVQNIDDLYVIRYVLSLLKRDEPDRALVTFYGKLAQGMTRDTFVGCESSGIEPLDSLGRQMGLPPNSTANASFLLQLRYLLVQDWDMDDDGRADTLRLAFAIPRRWLEDGKRIVVTNVPTTFGPLSLNMHSELSQGRITAELSLPPRPRTHTLIRFRVPDGWTVTSAQAGDQLLPPQGPETFDISFLHGQCTVRANVILGSSKESRS